MEILSKESHWHARTFQRVKHKKTTEKGMARSGTQQDWPKTKISKSSTSRWVILGADVWFFCLLHRGHIHGALTYMFQGLIAQVYRGILKAKGNDIDKKPLQVTWFTRDHSHNFLLLSNGLSLVTGKIATRSFGSV